jgi:hypothetical protein
MIAGNVNGVSLGFDQLRQSFLMAHPINAAFGITGNGPVRGAAANLAVQATVDMSYSPDVLAGRRRRRHAGGMPRRSGIEWFDHFEHDRNAFLLVVSSVDKSYPVHHR